MKISDPNLEFQAPHTDPPIQTVGHMLNNFIDNDRDFSFQPAEKRLNASFQQSGYNNYLLEQKQQLEEQKQRMLQLTQKANKAMNSEGYTDSDESIEIKSKRLPKNYNKIDQSLDSNESISIDESIKEINQIKCLFAQLIEHFIMSQTLKFQLQNRTYEIISKLYQHASTQYKQKIPLEEPISINTFSIVVKSILSEDYQLKTEVDIVVNKFYKKSNEISFDEIGKAMKSILNKKESQMFEPIQSKTEVDRTIQKTKRLFVAWISMHYFTQKIKQILRRKSFISTTIIKECAEEYDSQTFESSLLADFFFQGSSSITQRLKVEVFFRHILGKELKRKNFVEWYSNENMLSLRYERIGLKLSRQKHQVK